MGVVARNLWSDAFGTSADTVRTVAMRSLFDRLEADLPQIFASGDRTRELRQIDVPTLVIHGDRDRMVHPTGGEATARAIANARLETIKGMGHDLPRPAWPQLLDLITAHIAHAQPHELEEQR